MYFCRQTEIQRQTNEAVDIQSIRIFNNMLGETVFEGSVNCDVFDYDFSHQKAGIYFISVETSKGTETMKITVR